MGLLDPGNRLRHPGSQSEKQVTLTVDGRQVTVPEGTSIMRASMEAGVEIPKLCATDMLDSFGSCRVCLVEIDGRGGTPASCTTPVGEGMVVHTAERAADAIRRGVMELYVSDHPLGWDQKAGTGGSEIRQGRARGRPGGEPLRPRRPQPCRPAATASLNVDYIARDESNPYFTYDPTQCIVCSRCVRACEDVQGTFALTIEGRGFESRVSAGMHQILHRFGMRLLRRLRAGLPDRCAARKIDPREGPAGALRRHHLRLLRRRLLVQGRDARRRSGAHDAVQGRQGQSRPFLRQGPVRLWLCDPQGPHPEPDDPREDHRSVARSVVGGGARPHGQRIPPHPVPVRRAARSAASRRRAARTRRPISSRSWSGRASATTMSTPARASAIRRPATASARPSAHRPARRTSIRSTIPTSS